MMFQPDQPGRWLAVVSDGMGHQLTMEVDIVLETSHEAPDGFQTINTVHPGSSRIQGIVTGELNNHKSFPCGTIRKENLLGKVLCGGKQSRMPM